MLKLHEVEPDYPVDKYTFNASQVVKLLKLFHEAYNVSRMSPVPASAIQIAIIEYCQS